MSSFARFFSFRLLLIVGIAVRCVALNQPLIDAHLLRQCQTSMATRHMIEEPGWHLSSRLPWRGDTQDRLVQEFPLFNYLVIGVSKLGMGLDPSGKVTSILLWALAFWILQGIWRRVLRESEIPWANLLFTFAPLSIFFGQAFMPEMLVECCAFGFIATLLRYVETNQPRDFLIFGAVSVLASLVKVPETSHLYAIAGLLIFHRQGFGALAKPLHWLVLIVTAAVVKSWSHFMDAVNLAGARELTASEALHGMVGTISERFTAHPYVKIAGYLTLFVITPGGLFFVAWGILAALRGELHRLVLYWPASLILFYLSWGIRNAGEHSYYNLPALGPASLLFAIGVNGFLEWLEKKSLRPLAAWATVLLLIAGCGAGTAYLFRQDRILYTGARWVQANTKPGDLILLIANHRADMVRFPHNAAFPYYAERDTWIYINFIGEELKKRARETAQWAVVTHAPPAADSVESWRRRLRAEAFQVADESWLEKDGFQRCHEEPMFTVYRKLPGGG